MRGSPSLKLFLRKRAITQRAQRDEKRTEAAAADAEDRRMVLRTKQLAAEADLAKAKSKEAAAEAKQRLQHAKEERAAAKRGQEEQADEEELCRHHYAAWLARHLFTWSKDRADRKKNRWTRPKS